MNILFLGFIFPPSTGGVQYSNYEIVKVLKELGHNVTVLSRDFPQSSEFDQLQDFNIVRVKRFFPKKSKVKVVKLFYYIKAMIYIIKLENSNKYDKVIVGDDHARLIYGILKLLNISRIHNFDVITSVNEKIKTKKLNHKIKKKIIKGLYKKADKIICVSDSTKNEILDIYGDEIKYKTNIVYRTINENFLKSEVSEVKRNSIIKQLKLEESDIILLTVARLIKKKGIDNIIFSLNEIDNNIKLLIIGDGKDENRLKNIAKKTRIRESIFFLGNIPHEKIIDYYDLCDIFILPSRRGTAESFGRVFAEAAARRKPVIANNTGGVKEVVIDNKTGLLIDPENIDEISNAIKLLINDKKLRRDLGRNGFNRVNKLFSKARLKKEIRNLYGGNVIELNYRWKSSSNKK